MDAYTFLYTLMEECEFTFESVCLETIVQTPTLCRAGQPGKRDFFRCKPVPRWREFVKRIPDSASWANSIVMFSQSLCFKK